MWWKLPNAQSRTMYESRFTKGMDDEVEMKVALSVAPIIHKNCHLNDHHIKTYGAARNFFLGCSASDF